jgi:seryl-tRNA synthetase
MIDLKDLRANPDKYKESAKLRGVKVDIDKLINIDVERSGLLMEVEDLRSKLKLEGKPSAEQLKKLQDVKAKLEKAETEFNKLDEQFQNLLWEVPNLIADGTPEGDESKSREDKTWGKAEKSQAQDHISFAEEHDLLDFERATKVAGSKFLYTKGAAVILEMALMRYGLDKLAQAGFVPMTVPHMVNDRIAAGTGFLPRGEERQVYKIEGEDLNLIATAEMPLTGYHADEILDDSKLPLLYAGISPCYRLEAGAYGKHSKGYYRVHQFDKLEMYVLCKPEDSEDWHQKILAIEEEICQELEIPYRVVRIATGDLSAPAYKKYDLEYWSPVDGEYRELTSCSNCTDFQSRRLNIRTKTDGDRTFVHTLNGTAIAFSRLFIALIENHQGGVPKALQSYYGGKTL